MRSALRVALPAAFELARGAPAPLSRVASTLIAEMAPPPRLLGVEHIPAVDPFVVLFNHYESPRVAAWWAPLLLSHIIARHRTAEPREVRWLMAREWWYPGGFGRAFKQPLTQALFARLAQVYGLIRVPPILEGNLTRGEGAAPVRRALEWTRGPHPQLVGLSPEGRTGPQGRLTDPPQGTGLFLLLLTHDRLPCLPVGVFEDGPQLVLHFGPAFMLEDTRARDRRARDRAASDQVMRALAAILPASLRGPFSAST